MTIKKLLLMGAFALLVGLPSAYVKLRSSQPVPVRGSVAFSAQTESSTVAGPLNLKHLSDSASLIIVGRVLDLSVSTDAKKANHFNASVVISKVLKGSVSPPMLTIDFVRNPVRVAFTRTITSSVIGMFFLNPQAPSGYGLADGTVEALTAVEDGPTVAGSTLDIVINELGNVLNSSASTSQDKLEAIKALAGVNSISANTALRRNVARDANLKLQVQAALVRHGDLSALKEVEQFLLRSTGSDSSVSVNLSSAVMHGVRSPEAIPILARLLNAQDPSIRRASVHALREIGTASAWTSLAQALNDSDQMVRYDAVTGLAELTHDSTHEPSVETFKKNESEYLSYWRQRVRE